MKKSVILFTSLTLIISLPMMVNAYNLQDVLEVKSNIFGINETSSTVIDYLSIKSELLNDKSLVGTNEIYVSNTDELKNALFNANAGDEIILKNGVYQCGDGWTPFASDGMGTKENPIVIRSENPENMAEIMGTNPENSIALYITGDYWIIKDLKVSTAQKGIVLDNSNHSIISNCEVYNIGSEGVHFRDDSSYCTIEDSYIHDTGVVTKGYGEGVYVGSYYEEEKYSHSCDYNIIKSCIFKNISAEHVDIKEQTTGTIVEDCTMYGMGISGENYADSFIDIQGNGCIVRNNTCYQDKNETIVDAFQVHIILDGWGFDNQVYDNVCYFDNETSYILRGWDCGCTAQNNVRYPSGNTYADDSITILD
ncbi:MAG: right-handed parallel beta-helix repeat-containing protein [Oscillospiraceae bacterium]